MAGDLQIQGLDHVAITVSDLARSRRWYAEALGLERRFEDEWGDVPTMMCARRHLRRAVPVRRPAR